jgi:hypothetical protein
MHALTKFVDYMILFGSAINFFGGVGKCKHKTFVKDTGSNTQQRIELQSSFESVRGVPRLWLILNQKQLNFGSFVTDQIAIGHSLSLSVVRAIK